MHTEAITPERWEPGKQKHAYSLSFQMGVGGIGGVSLWVCTGADVGLLGHAANR